MPLAPGARLGPYEIVAALGAGGMGEVYKARDTRLDRVVAVKILAPGIAASPEARLRFDREARTISQLSHRHICAVYDVGQHDGIDYLVMELLDGETLAHRLLTGPLPIALTIAYAAQVADALDGAHRHGIVHRDLKPANVMITKSGVKLLDFGLAKAMTPSGNAGASGATIAVSPLTARGAIAGTVEYMAPEQLEGRAPDARSDIYALGAVIYEMATGERVFRTKAKPIAPPALDRILVTCLAIDPDERWQSAHDVSVQLRGLADSIDAAAVPPKTARIGRGPIAWLAGATLLIIVVAMSSIGPSRRDEAKAAVRFSLPPPGGGSFYESYENTGLSVSPDGSRLAFTAKKAAGPMQVWLRGVAELEARAVDGTEGARSLFWSPDGRSLAFFTGDKLRRIDLPGGTPVSICEVRGGIGFSGTWGADGQILFSSIEGEAIYRVTPSGGAAVVELKPDPGREEIRLNWPVFLPDGHRFLYLQRRRDGSGHLLIADPNASTREVRPMQSSAQYVAPGYLVFASDGALVGQRFDSLRGIVIGDPFSIADVVDSFVTTTVARFSTSPNGTLVYSSHTDEQQMTWFDHTGRETSTMGERGQYQEIRFSPDQRRVTYSRAARGALDVWETDLERGVSARLTFGVSTENAGPWLPDGRSFFFAADVGAPPRIFRKNLTTGSEELVIPGSGTMQGPEDVSPDGKTLIFTERAAGGGDIWTLAIDGGRPPTPIGHTAFDEESVRFSPDGGFFSFHSNRVGPL